jgi:hypothetical protein
MAPQGPVADWQVSLFNQQNSAVIQFVSLESARHWNGAGAMS